MNGAREEILARIRSALRDVPSSEQPQDLPVERDYLLQGSSDRAHLIERFTDRLVDYKAKVRHVSNDELPAAIAEACAAHGVKRLVVPADLPEAWLPSDTEIVADHNFSLSYAELDASDGVLTGCAIGVAQTGTIILDSGFAQGRRAITLVPDYHLCVVRADQIVDLIPEAVTNLQGAVRDHRRPITLISGPSATSDIELNRVEGVHGPRTLEVLIVVS
jgi:L-lactate dehydrogenase complex protein LldG